MFSFKLIKWNVHSFYLTSASSARSQSKSVSMATKSIQRALSSSLFEIFIEFQKNSFNESNSNHSKIKLKDICVGRTRHKKKKIPRKKNKNKKTIEIRCPPPWQHAALIEQPASVPRIAKFSGALKFKKKAKKKMCTLFIFTYAPFLSSRHRRELKKTKVTVQ